MVMIKLVGKPTIVLPGSIKFSLNPVAANVDAIEVLFLVFGIAKTLVTKLASSIDNSVLMRVPFCIAPESVIFGVRITRIMSLYVEVSKHCRQGEVCTRLTRSCYPL